MPGNKQPPGSRTLMWNLLIALGSILLLLAVAELYARLALGVHPTPDRFQLSHRLGWEWSPGYDAVETYHGVDYSMQISRQGLRNEPVTVPKPPETFRIIALGDSITESPGVELQGSFAKQLESTLLSTFPQTQFEVINAGTGDYGTQQESIWLRERGLRYQPDLVILEVYLNDSRGFTQPAAPIAISHNFFVRRSAFYSHYFNTVRQRRVSHEEAQSDFRFRFGEDWESQAWVDDPEALLDLIEQADQDWGLAWNPKALARIQQQLTQIIQLSHEQDFELLLVLFPVDAQVYATVDIPAGLDYPQQTLTDFGAEQGVPVLDLLPVLRAHRDQDLFYDQAHLKPDTHHIVADAILESLREEGLIPQP